MLLPLGSLISSTLNQVLHIKVPSKNRLFQQKYNRVYSHFPLKS